MKDEMICSKCVGPVQLKKLIDGQGNPGRCRYCKTVGIVVETHTLFDAILNLVRENVATEQDLSEYELGLIYECGADFVAVQGIDIVLSEWFYLGGEPYFDDLMAYVPKEFLENAHGQEQHYFSEDGNLELNIYEAKWNDFVQGVSHAHRFFNPHAKGFLDAVFSMLRSDGGKLRPEVVRVIACGQELYRARTVTDRDAARKIQDSPHTELGPTPKDKASSQRMTPHGIAALYCALERATCLSEIRSITGDIVVSGALTPTGQLRLLDLTKLEQVEPLPLTLFDRGYRDRLHLTTFLKSLVKKMSRPKGRNDELSYLATQVVFEFLRLEFGNEVDGLVFPSVQTGEAGTNVVLFPEACIVSAKGFVAPDELEKAFGPDPFAVREPFEEGAKLAFVVNSLCYHRVTAIETKAEKYDRYNDLFMSDLVRKRLGKLI